MAERSGQLVFSRGEVQRRKAYTLDVAIIQIFRELSPVDPRRAEQLERGIGTAAHAQVGSFDHTYAGVKGRFRQITEVRGRSHPREAGLVVPVLAVPAVHFHDIKA